MEGREEGRGAGGRKEGGRGWRGRREEMEFGQASTAVKVARYYEKHGYEDQHSLSKIF